MNEVLEEMRASAIRMLELAKAKRQEAVQAISTLDKATRSLEKQIADLERQLNEQNGHQTH